MGIWYTCRCHTSLKKDEIRKNVLQFRFYLQASHFAACIEVEIRELFSA